MHNQGQIFGEDFWEMQELFNPHFAKDSGRSS